MARDFDYGAEVAVGGGVNYKNPTPGAHDTVITAIVHIGSFADLFVKGNKREPKPPCNYVLVQSTLMGPDDKNEDGSPIQKWKAMPLKHGDRAGLTAFMAAMDPAEVMKGFNDVIGVPVTTTWKENQDKGKNEDGTWKAVNLTGYTNAAGRLADLIRVDFQASGITPIGHVAFKDITLEILEDIPAYLISQYFLSEGNGDNLSYAGSPVEAIINAKRIEDPDWKTKKDGDANSEEPGTEQRAGSTAGTQAIPEAANQAPPPDMEADKEF